MSCTTFIGAYAPGSTFGMDYSYLTDSQDLEALQYHAPGVTDDTTAAFVLVGEGEYLEVWVTTWSRWYEAHATYERVL